MYKKHIFRIISFNPNKYSKHSYKISFIWNYINHAWDVFMKDELLGWSSERIYSGDYNTLINNFADSYKYGGNYVTVKEYR